MKKALYRRSPDLICYWDHEGLVLENYVAHARVGVAPVAALVLHALDRWRSLHDLCKRFPEYDRASVQESVELLCQHKFVQRSIARKRLRDPLAAWREWAPTAAQFHFHTKDARFVIDPATEQQFYRQRAKQWPIPAPVKHYPRARRAELPPPETSGEFCRVLLERRTWRRFGPERISLRQLATLLQLTWGVQSWMRFPILGKLARKTAPSGGARHPIEVYVAALRVKGLARGIYHYSADAHCLEKIASAATPAGVEEWLAGQHWFRDAAAVFLMTAVFPRTQWKYPVPRTYRVVLADAGHLGQTFCLVATWLGLAPFCTMALADTRIENALGVDGITESALYAAGVGMKPADKRDPGDLPG